jgi:hypothetical protein
MGNCFSEVEVPQEPIEVANEVPQVNSPVPNDGMIRCPCGSVIKPSSVSQHMMTRKHRAYEEFIQKQKKTSAFVFPRHLLAMVMEHEPSCPICLDEFTIETITLTPCGHPICQECSPSLSTCPICRSPL